MSCAYLDINFLLKLINHQYIPLKHKLGGYFLQKAKCIFMGRQVRTWLDTCHGLVWLTMLIKKTQSHRVEVLHFTPSMYFQALKLTAEAQ